MEKMQRKTLGIATVDARKRISLARVILDIQEGDHFIVSQDQDGVILLTPAAVVSKRELEVIADPKLMKEINAGIKAAGEGKTRRYKPA